MFIWICLACGEIYKRHQKRQGDECSFCGAFIELQWRYNDED